MKHLDGLLKLVENEFEAIENNGKFRSREEIDSVYKLIDIAKDAYCIWAYEEEMDGGYSEESYDGGYSNRGYRGRSYDDGGMSNGMSYARGRGRNAKRDGMGRYSREGNSYDGGYSGRGGYSRNYSMADGNEQYIQELRNLMNNAHDEQTRQSLQRMIDKMEQG